MEDNKYFTKKILSIIDKVYLDGFVLLPFFDESKQILIKNICSKYNVSYLAFGGYEDADYKRILLYLDGYDKINFDISIIKINTIDKLDVTHRDVLGSVLALGLKREVIGDIVINDSIYLVCAKHISSFIIENLFKIKNQYVTCTIYNDKLINVRKYEDLTIFASSMRLDLIVSNIINQSRNATSLYILGQNVKVNHFLVTNVDKKLKIDDVISLKGYGRYIIDSLKGTSKSNNLILNIKKIIT